MNSLLTSVAGQFAKPLLLSALLPVIIVTSLLLALVYPLFPISLSLPDAVTHLDVQWQVAWATLVGLVASMLLFILNAPIVRLFSGYPWRDVFPGTVLANRRRAQFQSLTDARDALLSVLVTVADADERHRNVRQGVTDRLTPVAQMLNRDFPYGKDLILPTKLGNVIRNFEDYSRQQYGISAVPLWPRLIGVVDSRYATVLDDAKTSFDFALNCLFLLCCAAGVTVVLAVLKGASGALLAAALWRAALFAVLAMFAYAAAINRAREWGSYVKGAVDLYRGALLKQLGYQLQVPAAVSAERANIWPLIASQWDFPDMNDVQTELPFAPPAVIPPPATSAGSADAAALSWARGVSAPAGKPYAVTEVTIRVHNAGAAPATKVVVTDAVPPNWTFEWDSVAVSSGRHTLKSSSPVAVEIDEIAANTSLTLTYRLRSLVASV